MKEKTIKSVLAKKFAAWVATIKDEALRKMVYENTIITGGCFVSLVLNEKPNDYDVYFRNRKTALAVAHYYAKEFNDANGDKIVQVKEEDDERIKLWIQSQGVAGEIPETADAEITAIANALEEIEETVPEKDKLADIPLPKYRPVFFSANAISLSDKVQLTVRFYGEPSDIHDTYDFVHTKAYWTSWEKKVVIPNEVYEAIINKSLVYTGSHYPVCSVFRLRKFIKRGWNVNAGQMLKIAFQISQLDLTDLKVFEDQLVGVDSAYFMQLIVQLQKQKEKNPDFQFNQAYLIGIIDKIF